MPQFLELAHLFEQHGMAEMYVRRRRIKARLDPERNIFFIRPLELFLKVFFADYLDSASFDYL